MDNSSDGRMVVRPITSEIFGGPDTPWRSITLLNIWTVDISRFWPGKSDELSFLFAKGKDARFAVFAAKLGNVERAFLLMVPSAGTPSSLLIVITHGFGQNHAFYSSLGYSNPLSPPLVKWVTDTFLIGRWGPQTMAASNDYALLLPVRALGGGHGELGPFTTHPDFGAELVDRLIVLTDRAFAPKRVELVTFSSGIYDANTFVAAGGRSLHIQTAYNQDPAGGARISTAVPERKEYLSGMTTRGPHVGFEYLPLGRWKNEPKRSEMFINNDVFNYLHSWCIPIYTLYMGMAGP
jgi:hypothetical protein